MVVHQKEVEKILSSMTRNRRRNFTSIGDLPVGAGVAMATPDKERNLSTRNQHVMTEELFTIMKPVHDA